MRLRFSTRTLFVVPTLLALLLAWVTTPTWHARQFARALDNRNYALADRILRPTTQRAIREPIEPHTKLYTHLSDWSLVDLLRGKRCVSYHFVTDYPSDNLSTMICSPAYAFSPFGVSVEYH